MESGLSIPNVNINEKELAVFQERACGISAQADRIATTIHSNETCEVAAQWCIAQDDFIRGVDDGWLGQVRDIWHKEHDRVCKIIRSIVQPHKSGIDLVKLAIKQWRAQEARRVAEEQANLLAEAKKRDEEQRLNAAVVLEEQGNKTMAKAVLDGAGNFTAPPITKTEQIKGISGSKRWVAQVEDPYVFIKYVAERPTLMNALTVNVKWLEAQAKLLDGNVKYPGIRFYEDETISLRRSA